MPLFSGWCRSTFEWDCAPNSNSGRTASHTHIDRQQFNKLLADVKNQAPLSEISICESQITPEQVSDLADALSSKSTPPVQILKLENVGIEDSAATDIASMLKDHPTLLRLELSNNPLITNQGARRLADAIKENAKNDHVLIGFRLRHCSITPDGAKFLIDALEENTNLQDFSVTTTPPLNNEYSSKIHSYLVRNRMLSQGIGSKEFFQQLISEDINYPNNLSTLYENIMSLSKAEKENTKDISDIKTEFLKLVASINKISFLMINNNLEMDKEPIDERNYIKDNLSLKIVYEEIRRILNETFIAAFSIHSHLVDSGKTSILDYASEVLEAGVGSIPFPGAALVGYCIKTILSELTDANKSFYISRLCMVINNADPCETARFTEKLARRLTLVLQHDIVNFKPLPNKNFFQKWIDKIKNLLNKDMPLASLEEFSAKQCLKILEYCFNNSLKNRPNTNIICDELIGEVLAITGYQYSSPLSQLQSGLVHVAHSIPPPAPLAPNISNAAEPLSPNNALMPTARTPELLPAPLPPATVENSCVANSNSSRQNSSFASALAVLSNAEISQLATHTAPLRATQPLLSPALPLSTGEKPSIVNSSSSRQNDNSASASVIAGNVEKVHSLVSNAPNSVFFQSSLPANLEGSKDNIDKNKKSTAQKIFHALKNICPCAHI